MTPRWCGDSILDTGHGEVCDDGAENGQPGKCNLTCTGTPPIVPSCDNLTVSPTIGQAPFDVTMNCAATNATNYVIDCGDGNVNL